MAALFVAEALTVEVVGLWLARGRPVVFGAVRAWRPPSSDSPPSGPGRISSSRSHGRPRCWRRASSRPRWRDGGRRDRRLLGSGLRASSRARRIARAALITSFTGSRACRRRARPRDRPPGAPATVTLQQVDPRARPRDTGHGTPDPRDLADGAASVRVSAAGLARRISFPLGRVSAGSLGPAARCSSTESRMRPSDPRRPADARRLLLRADRWRRPAAEVPALPRFTPAPRQEREILQRERRRDVPGWLWTAARLAVLALMLPLFVLLASGVTAWPDPRSAGRRVTRTRPIQGRVVLVTAGAAASARMPRRASSTRRRVRPAGPRRRRRRAPCRDARRARGGRPRRRHGRRGARRRGRGSPRALRRDDVMIADAISRTMATIAGIDPEDFEQVIEVDLLGVWRTVRGALPHVVDTAAPS